VRADDGSDRQIEYYRALAPEYLDNELDEPGAEELLAAVEEHAPGGTALELACGPGTWTPLLLRRASHVTAVDAAAEMLALARARVGADHRRVRFVRADLFDWQPPFRQAPPHHAVVMPGNLERADIPGVGHLRPALGQPLPRAPCLT
jgi:SAM-dependent methyltransferase